MSRLPPEAWGEADLQRSQLHDLHARAGVLASESSLIGLSCALAVATAVGLWVIPTVVLPFARSLLASAAGLAAIGLLLACLARGLKLGGEASPKARRGWWPMCVAAFALAMVEGVALWGQSRHEVGLGSQPVAVLEVWSSWLLLAATGGLGLGLVGLAAVGLRQLAVWWPDPNGGESLVQLPALSLHLYATLAHLCLGGVGLLALIGLAGGARETELRDVAAVAVTTLSVHAALSAVWLLGGVRRSLRPLRAAGVRLSTLERGYALAGAGVTIGLLLPGLVALANLLDVTSQGLPLACALGAASSHAVRYGLVLLSWTRPQPHGWDVANADLATAGRTTP